MEQAVVDEHDVALPARHFNRRKAHDRAELAAHESGAVPPHPYMRRLRQYRMTPVIHCQATATSKY